MTCQLYGYVTASFKASFSGSSYGQLADWSAYFLDTQYEAAMIFAPTSCGCYGSAGAPGVDIYFRDPVNPNAFVSQFIPLDLTQTHSYEFLLKGGAVSYRIDGHAYSGLAGQVGYFGPLLVIGDGSGSTGTGVGEMTIRATSLDNAPIDDVLLSSVPEPATWAMLLAGFGVAGGALRRRRDRAAVAPKASRGKVGTGFPQKAMRQQIAL